MHPTILKSTCGKLAALAAAIAATATIPSFAETEAVWTGNGTTDLTSDAANWDIGRVPDQNCNVCFIIEDGDPAAVIGGDMYWAAFRVRSGTIIQTNGTVTTKVAPWIGTHAERDTVGWYKISGGKLTVGSNYDIALGYNGDEGHLDISGTGEVSCKGVYLGYYTTAGAQGYVSLKDSGKLTTSGDSYIGYQAGNKYSEFNQAGGTASFGSAVYIGNAGSADSVSKYVMSGGTATIATWLNVGQTSGKTGAFEMYGGTMTIGNRGGGHGLNLGRNGNGTMTIYDGTISVQGVFYITKANTANGTLNLLGGTLAVDNDMCATYSAGATFNWNGGTLKAQKAGRLIQSSVPVMIGERGAKIDPNKLSVSIEATLSGSNPLCLLPNTSGTITLPASTTLNIAFSVSPEKGAGTYTVPTVVSDGGTLTYLTKTPDGLYNVAWSANNTKVTVTEVSLAQANWNGNGETASLGDAGNWDALPSTVSDVRIAASGVKSPTVPDGTTTYASFSLSSGTMIHSAGTLETSKHSFIASGSGDATYNLSGGTLSIEGWLNVGQNAGRTGTFNMTGGRLMTGSMIGIGRNGTGVFEMSDGSILIRAGVSLPLLSIARGKTGNGTFRMSGGTVRVPGDMYVGDGNGESNTPGNSRAVFELSGGSVMVNGMFEVGKYGCANGTATISGGVMTISGETHVGGIGTGKYVQTGGENDCDSFYVANSTGSTGEVELRGGSLVSRRFLSIGRYGTGSYTQSGGLASFEQFASIGRYSAGVGTCTVTGGTFRVTDTLGGLYVGNEGRGTMDVGGDAFVEIPKAITIGYTVNSSGAMTLRDNARIVAPFIKNGASANTSLTFDGGTFEATAATNILEGIGNIALKAGGVTIDTQGYDLTIKDCTFNVYPNGKITVVGGGTVTFVNCTASLTAKPSTKFVFAETDGVFSGMPAFTNTQGCKVKMSADNKKISVVPSSFMLIIK